MPKKKAPSVRRDEDFFGSFDEELVEMRERMDRIFEAFMKNELGPDRTPLVYNLSMQTGDDGESVMQEFGNAPEQALIDDGESQEREPLIDVLESDALVRVIVELPGVQKDDIKIDAHERSLEVTVDNEVKQFHELIELPCAIQPDSVKASYKNGVLMISMNRIVKKRKGQAVQVE
jgi:HSP20 family protein